MIAARLAALLVMLIVLGVAVTATFESWGPPNVSGIVFGLCAGWISDAVREAFKGEE